MGEQQSHSDATVNKFNGFNRSSTPAGSAIHTARALRAEGQPVVRRRDQFDRRFSFGASAGKAPQKSRTGSGSPEVQDPGQSSETTTAALGRRAWRPELSP